MGKDDSNEIRVDTLSRRISLAQDILSGKNPQVFLFTPEDGGSQDYIVLGQSPEDAIERFKHWQKQNKSPENRWDDEVIENFVDNWFPATTTTHVIL